MRRFLLAGVVVAVAALAAPGPAAAQDGDFTYRATLSWREGDDRRSMTTRLYVHRRFPGGRG